ncbi:NADPH:quinone oxidoreductase family protein [Sphingorhabdus pulchriflava]|uniref:NADPH:quinone oxidoreductase family protein n=1 Tax=Sphingorhabdus pulchriflava TaxID=2292257 RepID=A0A371BIW8_9SPHN|nr:NADPH:quinone oxidoreductase family protein [Sphingorhabdus pulchriflava]RDV07508.1 NADPH:quinone oxidoreductase family protein [Sphingorhabdus pulchriflava]
MTYRAAVCTALTGPESIRIEERHRAPLHPGEVRIAIKAAGLNFPDLLMTYGKYQFRPDPPFVPGMEFSGEVIEVGSGVTNWQPGEAVMGGGKGDCIAEEAVVPAAALVTKPDALSWEEAACWRAGGVTAWHALHDKAALKAGETLLVLGAAGGVGMAAVSLGKYMGATVIGTGSSLEKRSAILAAGADHALDPADPDLATKVKELTGSKGCDVVFDPVGGDLSITATRAIGWGGRFLIVGFASGSTPSFPANHALIKGYSLIGLRAGEASRRDPELAARTSIELKKLAEVGIMRPHISHRLPLDQTRDALLVLERREAIGRVVVTLGD